MATFQKIYKHSRIWIVLLLAIAFPLVTTNKYLLMIFSKGMLFAMMTLSLNILSGYTGLMSVGHIAFYGIGAYTSAILTTRYGMPILFGILMAGVISSLGSLLLGLPTMRLRGMYFSVATLAFGGPYALMRLAEECCGFQPDAGGYVSPCDLCFRVRSAMRLKDRDVWSELGPDAFYG